VWQRALYEQYYFRTVTELRQCHLHIKRSHDRHIVTVIDGKLTNYTEEISEERTDVNIMVQ